LTRSKGALVIIASTAALAALPIIPAYSISKAAPAKTLEHQYAALVREEGVAS